MAIPRTRRIEEVLREAQQDPRLIAILCDIAERQKVQHQQILQFAQLFVKMQSVMEQMLDKLAVRDGNLQALGVKEMLTNFQNQREGNMVESVEEFDQGQAAHNMDTGRKN